MELIRKLNRLPEWQYNLVISAQTKTINSRLNKGEVYSTEMSNEALKQAFNILSNLKNKEVCFYPKGEKYGKKVTGKIVAFTAEKVDILFEGKIYNPKNICVKN